MSLAGCVKNGGVDASRWCGVGSALPVSMYSSRGTGLYFLNPSFSPQAADLDGEIDLSTCYDVTEYPVQRNYGFQIHVSWVGFAGRLSAGVGPWA